MNCTLEKSILLVTLGISMYSSIHAFPMAKKDTSGDKLYIQKACQFGIPSRRENFSGIQRKAAKIMPGIGSQGLQNLDTFSR